MSEWTESTLDEEYEFTSGLSKSRDQFGFGYGFVSFKDVFYNYFLPSELGELANTTEKEQKSCSVKRGDVFLTRTSETFNELGMSSVALKDYDRATFNGFTKRLRPKQNSKIWPEYIGYYFRSSFFRSLVTSMATMTTRASLNNEILSKLKVKYPPLPEQKAIAHILGTLDVKIALNRQMNQTLEAMAQALFKSWFVDFDPVMDNALAAGNEIPDGLQAMAEKRQLVPDSKKLISTNPELAAKFPSSFVFNETLGKWIPEGWEVKEIKKIAKPIKENKKATEILDTDIYVGLEHIQRKRLFLSENGVGSDITSNKSAFQKGDILFGKLRPYFHKICIAPINGVCSTDILIFRARKIEFNSFLTYFLFQEELVEYVNKRSTGTRMPRANQNDILSYKLALPKDQILISFEDLIRPTTGKALSNIEENKTLTQLRDRLLPELISGKVRIREAEELIEQELDTVAERRSEHS